MEENQTKPNLEDAFQGLFTTSVSGSGEDELLRIASDFSMQLTASQVRCLMYLKDKAFIMKEKGQEKNAERLEEFVKNYLTFKRNNNSDQFVMRALDSISLKKLFNENTLKMNLMKNG